ncbi:MAG: YciI-like protein [Gemmatimonadota bacterium]
MTEFRHYLLFYDTAPDYLQRRSGFRSKHLHLLEEARDRGELVLGGALAHPVDGAVILFKGASPEVAENFARIDPYVTEGLVTSWKVREWTTVVGDGAASPVQP